MQEQGSKQAQAVGKQVQAVGNKQEVPVPDSKQEPEQVLDSMLVQAQALDNKLEQALGNILVPEPSMSSSPDDSSKHTTFRCGVWRTIRSFFSEHRILC